MVATTLALRDCGALQSEKVGGFMGIHATALGTLGVPTIFFSVLYALAAAASPICDVKVGRVSDGDTFYSPTVRVVSPTVHFAQDTRFRLARVGAPERKQEGYEQAKNDLRDLIEGRYLAVKVLEKERDPRGGLIVEAFLCDGTNVNDSLRARGWADKGNLKKASKGEGR